MSSRLLPPPIPEWVEPPNWARIPIRECGQVLVTLPSDTAWNLLCRPFYAEAGIPGATSAILVRARVAEMLFAVADSLRPQGACLVVFDGYRPLAVQRFLHDSFRAELTARHPEFTEAELSRELGRYVASPNADPACPPPHRTGGAVDVFLVSADTGKPLPMGTEPDAAVPESATRFYEAADPSLIAVNRRLLFHAMQDSGFRNYHGEWWHFDFGNQRWANLNGAETAIYGQADPADG